jgi:hypothetical protein
MPNTYDLETRGGVRRVEFDPDVFRSREVRILVDGKRTAEMPYPTAAAPYQEVTFQLGDHALVAIAELSVEAGPAEGFGLIYDLFADGRSLSGGASLEMTRSRAPAPGTSYPSSFRVIDVIYVIAPAAAASSASITIARSADKLGWQTTITLIAGLLAALIAAGAIGVRIWSRVRADTSRSVTRRATLGAIVALACYGAAFAGWLVVALLMGLGRR